MNVILRKLHRNAPDQSIRSGLCLIVLMYRLLQTGKADIYTRDDSDLIHETTARVREVQKLLLDLLMMQESAPDRINTVVRRDSRGAAIRDLQTFTLVLCCIST
eukprot:COSAG02_NODE_168_length_31711_cov_68.337973_24_plen_104_part_00